MNNKASKRLLAASVASLMLVVAFCGFTYAGDDADAEGNGTAGSPYVKKITVAEDAENGINDEIATFNIVTTQNVSSPGTGISHTGSWKLKNDDSGISDDKSSPSHFTGFDLSVETDGHVHEFTFTVVGTDLVSPVDVYYELTSQVGGKEITQKIYYRIDATVVHALPASGTASITGYVGVGLVNKVEDVAGSWLMYDKTGLMFYAETLPDGLSMNIDGTISGVPKSAFTGDTTVYVYNETSCVSTHTITWTISNKVASITEINVSGTDLVKIIDGRYLVKEGTGVTIQCTVGGNDNGNMTIGDVPASKSGSVFSAPITISGTGEKEIVISYTYELDGDAPSDLPDLILEQYITVVSVDVVSDATTGIGIASGVTFAQP